MLLKDTQKLEEYIEKIENFSSLTDKEVVDRFAFFVLSITKLKTVRAFQLEDCFVALNLRPYTRIAAYLSEESAKKKTGKYVHSKTGGYVLERAVFKKIKEEVDKSPKRQKVTKSLESLVASLKDTQEANFLKEAIDCLSVNANRAAIVMTWILTMDHLQKMVFKNKAKLKKFNQALSKNPDKKIKRISVYDDFSDLKESKVLELLRAAKIVSNDVWKILDGKLDIRNTAGHPSAVVIGETKTDDFISDLVQNVLLKY